MGEDSEGDSKKCRERSELDDAPNVESDANNHIYRKN